MKRCIPLLAVLALVLAGCAKVTETHLPPLNSGIGGTVVMGPTCPVEQAGSPCPFWRTAVQAHVFATDANGTRYGPILTDAQGRFTFRLGPGTYSVSAAVVGDNAVLSKPQTVVVSSGRFTQIQILIDTGIR